MNENDENKNDENNNDVIMTTSAKKKPKPNDIEKTVNKYELIYKTEDTVGEEEYEWSKQNVHQKTKPSVATSGVNIVRVKDPVFKVTQRGVKLGFLNKHILQKFSKKLTYFCEK